MHATNRKEAMPWKVSLMKIDLGHIFLVKRELGNKDLCQALHLGRREKQTSKTENILWKRNSGGEEEEGKGGMNRHETLKCLPKIRYIYII